MCVYFSVYFRGLLYAFAFERLTLKMWCWRYVGVFLQTTMGVVMLHVQMCYAREWFATSILRVAVPSASRAERASSPHAPSGVCVCLCVCV